MGGDDDLERRRRATDEPARPEPAGPEDAETQARDRKQRRAVDTTEPELPEGTERDGEER